MFKFYYAPHTCALASHIALEQAGAAFETVRLDFTSNGQRTAEYLAINPKGRVPALKRGPRQVSDGASSRQSQQLRYATERQRWRKASPRLRWGR